ncbi:carbohydrate ABC transporter substrate-binding protein (CUT1 family) [Streptomyces sp. SLBN-118]|uniref:sugar ABC transporter substrate-binding protein n=1 Tax=Streptomyces sp. SLBN-118 TaxID=2768454 RepID=UPI00114E0C73|nr:sugar ABC transporter substrate-binding protein [Streptomyces sp. SLBN-118]TQK51731.1 carbohydrate ABC transporter substrate-binding protein (CUT1 family) [Streptomyces sp. SLBN-118]
MVLRRASAAAVCMAAVVVLAACGRDDGGASSTPSGTVPSGKVTGTITMWAQGTEGEKLPELIKGFEAENPGVKVNVTAIPWGDAHAKYQAAIAGGTTPDVAQMGTTWMADFASSFQGVPSGIDTSDIFPDGKATAVVKGATVGVPWYLDTRVIYYRADLAKKAGYSSPPKTWDEFKAMAKALQTKAGAKWGIALPPGGGGTFESILPFAFSGGASLMNSAGSEWTLDSPQMIGAMKYYQSFFTQGIANPNLTTAPGAQESAFVNGSTPMLITGGAGISGLNQAGGAGFESKYAVMPFPAKVSSTSFVGGSNLVVFRNSPRADAAWKLVQYLTKASIQASWYKATGDLPAVQSAWNVTGLSTDPKLKVFKQQLGSVKAPPANTAWTQVATVGDSQVERIVKGADPSSALESLQKSAESIGTGN